MHTRIKKCICLWYIYTQVPAVHACIVPHKYVYIWFTMWYDLIYQFFEINERQHTVSFKWTRNMGPVICHRNNTENNSKIVSYPLIFKWQKSTNLQWIFFYLFQVNLKLHAYMTHNWITLLCNFNSVHPPK